MPRATGEAKSAKAERAVRATVRGRVQGVGFRMATSDSAARLGVLGWVRNQDDDSVLVHAEGDAAALTEFLGFLGTGPPGATVGDVEVGEVKVEGHEQFAIRGLSAGRFVVEEQPGKDGKPVFLLRLPVDGSEYAWRLDKAPSMVPADKRFGSLIARDSAAAGGGDDADPTVSKSHAAVWDTGTYEQGGRVAWPEAIERGHAVFVLHGEQLRGGFALQRTRSDSWLLIKRRDEYSQ